MKPVSRCHAVLFATLLATAVPAGAAVLASYTFSTGNQAASTHTEPLTTAGAFNISGGSYPTDTSTSGFSVSQHVFFRSSALNDTVEEAVTAGDYVSFVMTPSAIFDLTTLSLNFGGSSDNNGAFTVSGYLRTSVDAYGGNVGTPVSQLVPSSAVGGTPTYGSLYFDLTTLPDVSTAVEFRIYLTSTGTLSPQVLRVDDVQVNGTLVPEPTAAGLLALSGCVIVFRRRRGGIRRG